ncbi:MAG TPA: ABC transporter, partial [Gammaproteobacteria bacterium]|nr:ABC transporter [Gammaproteobacteria bacterium]
RPLQRELEKLDLEMERLNAEKIRLETVLADTGTYEESNKELLTESLKKQAQVNGRLAQVEERWLDVHAELEQIA